MDTGTLVVAGVVVTVVIIGAVVLVQSSTPTQQYVPIDPNANQTTGTQITSGIVGGVLGWLSGPSSPLRGSSTPTRGTTGNPIAADGSSIGVSPWTIDGRAYGT